MKKRIVLWIFLVIAMSIASVSFTVKKTYLGRFLSELGHAFLYTSGALDMSKNEAESYVTDYMEEKYGDSFKVLSIQKMDLGHDEFRDHIYRMKFHSAALDSDIDIDVRRVSRDIIENYEQVLYEKRVLDEIGSVKRDQSGWSVRECSPHFEN